MKDLHFRIRHARRHAALSQTALANSVGVNRSAVAQWEQPGGSHPTSGNLIKIAVATLTRFEWMATGRGPLSLKQDPANIDDTPAAVLQYYAHDEIEERTLIAMRKLEYWQTVAIAKLAETLANRELKM
jgi:transcriptional regulator with XRE-family HTH domain